jgi:hypothetical protein
MEGIDHVESDGVENYGNERKFQLQYVDMGKIKGYLQGYATWCRSSK